MFSNFIALLSLIISIVTLVIMYRFTKRQTEAMEMDTMLNVSNRTVEGKLKKQAKLVANVQYHEGRKCIFVVNQGEAIATNVEVAFDEELSRLLHNKNTDIEKLRPNESKIYRYVIHDASPSSTIVKLRWEDDYDIENKEEHRLNL